MRGELYIRNGYASVSQRGCFCTTGGYMGDTPSFVKRLCQCQNVPNEVSFLVEFHRSTLNAAAVKVERETSNRKTLKLSIWLCRHSYKISDITLPCFNGCIMYSSIN